MKYANGWHEYVYQDFNHLNLLPYSRIHIIDDQVHREDGPAILHAKSTGYVLHNQYHREGGPAIINLLGESWRHRGKCHREDGPAVIYNDGAEIWWINHINVDAAVKEWMEENNCENWKNWSDEIKIMFKLRFL